LKTIFFVSACHKSWWRIIAPIFFRRVQGIHADEWQRPKDGSPLQSQNQRILLDDYVWRKAF
jgi:hypothetical protein